MRIKREMKGFAGCLDPGKHQRNRLVEMYKSNKNQREISYDIFVEKAVQF